MIIDIYAEGQTLRDLCAVSSTFAGRPMADSIFTAKTVVSVRLPFSISLRCEP